MKELVRQKLESRYIQFFVILILLLTGPMSITGCDTITITGPGSSQKHGLLVGGIVGDEYKKHQPYKGLTHEEINLGINFKPSPAGTTPGQVIFFGDSHAPTIRTTYTTTHNSFSWDESPAEISVDGDNRIPIKVNVFILAGEEGDFSDLEQDVVEACQETSNIWTHEHQGIYFSEFNVFDATGEPDRINFSCPVVDLPNDIRNISGSDGVNVATYDSKRINIYVVDSVMGEDGIGGSGSAMWCQGDGRPLVAIGRKADPHLFTHEIGHAFDLRDINFRTHPIFNDPSKFKKTNVMYQSSDERLYLTEGQTYRAVVEGESAINKTFEARQIPALPHNLPIVRCPERTKPEDGDENEQRECPSIWERVWEDP